MREPGGDHVDRAAGKGEPRDVAIDSGAIGRHVARGIAPAVEARIAGDGGRERDADFIERRICERGSGSGRVGHACYLGARTPTDQHQRERHEHRAEQIG